MKKIKNIVMAIILFQLFFFSCNKSDDNNEVSRTQIIDDSVESADVNAVDYWNETEIVWRDEFDGNILSKDNWLTADYYDGVFNSELQSFSPNNIEVSNGTLKIKVEKVGEGQKGRDYTSAQLTSKYAFKYGRLEFRAKLPPERGNGLWVKLWMLGDKPRSTSSPDRRQISFMKYVSHIPGEYASTATTTENYGGQGNTGTSPQIVLEDMEEEFHIYGILWTHEYLKFYHDDINNITFVFERPPAPDGDNWPFTEPFYFGLDIAVGGEFGGIMGVDDSIFPTAMEVDYIRVYHAR